MGQPKGEALFGNIWAGDERNERGRFQRIRPPAINRAAIPMAAAIQTIVDLVPHRVHP